MNFLNLPPSLSRQGECRFTIWPVPVDLTTSWKAGTTHGPHAIIDASAHIEYYDEEFGCSPAEKFGGVATLSTFRPDNDHEQNYRKLLEVAHSTVNKDQILISLGGEHSITHPIVEAHLQTWPDLCVLQIDAHADLRDQYHGSKHNHACPMKRLYDLGVHVTAVGIRSVDESEAGLLNGELRRTFADFEHNGNYIAAIPAIIASLPSDNLYISIDLDGLNPAEMPAVGTPIPGGLTWLELKKMMQALAGAKNIVGMDVVELSPRDGLHLSDSLAARIIYKSMSYISGL